MSGSELSVQDLAGIPLRQRVALGAFVVERVADAFSQYFRDKYKPSAAIDIAWRFAMQGVDDADERTAVSDELGSVTDEADEEGYGFASVAMAALLLEEIETDDGEAVYGAIEYAGQAFANSQLFRYGYTIGDRGVSVEHVDQLGMPVHEMARAALPRARQARNSDLSKKLFNGLNIKAPSRPGGLPLGGSGRSVPPAER